MRTADELRALVSHPNVTGFSRLVREGESSQDYSAYRIVNGGSFFSDFSGHPFGEKKTTEGGKAAGAHQWLPTTWADLKRRYPAECKDFSPSSQEFAFVAKLEDRHALDDVLAGNITDAIAKCVKEWTSLPGAAENSGRYTLKDALKVYGEYGGRLHEVAPPPSSHAKRTPSETLQDVSPEDVDAVAKSFKAEGAKVVTRTKQQNGLYTVTATFEVNK